MYQVAVCEDEPLAAKQNEDMVCRIFESKHMRRDIDYAVTCFLSPAPLLAQMQQRPDAFHLLLLDIELETENGISFAARLRKMGAACSIVYITAYREYVFDCFDTRPLHYLLKPVEQDKLAAVIDRDLKENYNPQKILLPVDGCWRTVAAHEILYAEAASHKSAVHLKDGVLYIKQNFSSLLSRVNGQRFCRCHFSILVNLEHVRRLHGSFLELDDGRQLPVSRSRQKDVKKQYIAFLSNGV